MSTDIQQAAIALTNAAEAYRRIAIERLATASIDELHTMAAASAAEAIAGGAVRVVGPAKRGARKAPKALAKVQEAEPVSTIPARVPRGLEAVKSAVLGALANGELKSEDLQTKTRVDKATLKKLLPKLRADNLIGMRGEKRAATYFLK